MINEPGAYDNDHWDGINPPEVYIDWLNQEVRVGDTVLYARTVGRSATVTMGKVLEFRTTDAQGKPLQRTHWGYTYHGKSDQPEVTHLWNFKIRPMKDALGYGRDRNKEGDIKPVVIGTVHNITKVDASLADEVDAE